MTVNVQRLGDFQHFADTVASGIPAVLWTAYPDGRLEWCSVRWYAYTGMTPAEREAGGMQSAVHPDDWDLLLARWREALERSAALEIETRLRRHDAVYRWFLTRAAPMRDGRGTIVRWCGVSTDIDDLHRARTRERFYAEVTQRLAGALTLDDTLRIVVDMLVPEFADYALVNLLAEDGSYVCAAVQHRDPSKREVLDSLVGHSYLRAMGPDTHTSVYTAVPRGRAETPARPRYRPVFEALGVESRLVVPLTYRGRVVGRLTCMMSGSGRAFTEADAPLFEEIARRVAPAIGNAEAYERERRVAHTFQDAALQTEMPRIPGLRFDAIYEAAHAEATVGGDWYDAFRLPDGRVVLSIGDVAGSGLDAAVTMGSVRQSIRTAALINPDPVAVLDAVDRIVRAMGGERFVTAFVGLLDPLTFDLTYASAGHPPPLVRTPGGAIERLASGELPLGLRERVEAPSHRLAIEPGSILVAYTDGLIEFDRDPLSGERAVIDALQSVRGRDVARAIGASITRGRASRDDVAILAVTLERRLGEIGGVFGTNRWGFATRDADAARRARRAFTGRLTELGLGSDDVASAELVFGELLGNAVRYAEGDVEIVLDASADAPVLHVLDEGEGFELRRRLPADPMSERGRGLYLAQVLSEELSVECRAGGGSHARAVLSGRARRRRERGAVETSGSVAHR